MLVCLKIIAVIISTILLLFSSFLVIFLSWLIHQHAFYIYVLMLILGINCLIISIYVFYILHKLSVNKICIVLFLTWLTFVYHIIISTYISLILNDILSNAIIYNYLEHTLQCCLNCDNLSICKSEQLQEYFDLLTFYGFITFDFYNVVLSVLIIFMAILLNMFIKITDNYNILPI